MRLVVPVVVPPVVDEPIVPPVVVPVPPPVEQVYFARPDVEVADVLPPITVPEWYAIWLDSTLVLTFDTIIFGILGS